MTGQPQVHCDAQDVEARLNRLGLTTLVLLEAVVAGEFARIACAANMPLCFPGMAAWAHTVTELRDRLIPDRWEKSDAGNYPVIVSPSGDFAIGVATGNEYTGSRYVAPKTKFPKGPLTVERVEFNGQYSLFGPPDLVRKMQAGPRLTWLLLIARTARGVRSELSLPDGIGEDGRVDGWMERILLPMIDPTQGGGIPLPEPGPDFDVDVVRRVG